ncbi:hypothetical protein LOC68_03070 [Blastopirellula sp. JC732]|uniref:Uncharacterized protein n=1 Tax=Blastopirellula sediminis TaxID=2894196 RepID=A0A9X1MIG2_9BACT|nr:hypothetical protein [Blastopirellula sediminis]MCC9607841.1 hypothetical protein [Blastopirellula sediminis]MCC9627366.1 hypothetical protein [Blastopirellula sediminis]
MLKKRKTWYLICALLVCTLVGGSLWALFGPSRPIVISKKTTYLTGPIGPDGNVDYWEYVQTERAKGATPENNGAIPVLMAMDLEPWVNAEQRSFAMEQLGLSDLPATVSLPLRDEQLKAEAERWFAEEALVQFGDVVHNEWCTQNALRAVSRSPWTAGDFPPLAAWLTRHGPAIDRLREVEGRTYWYLPQHASQANSDRFLYAEICSGDLICEARNLLRMRAMFHLGNGDLNSAWRDLRAEFQFCLLANPLSSDSEEFYRRIGLSESSLALHQLVIHPRCDEALLQEIESTIRGVRPPYYEPGTVLFQRLKLLQGVGHDYQGFIDSEGEQEFYYRKAYSISRLPINGNQLLRRINYWFDQVAAAASISDVTQRRAAIIQFRNELDNAMANYHDSDSEWRLYLSPVLRTRVPADNYTLEYTFGGDADFYCDEAEGRLQLLQGSIALQRYYLRNGRYPATWAELPDELPPMLTKDRFALSDCRYRRTDEGYLLYLLGWNERDDLGTDWRSEYYRGQTAFRHERLHYGGTDWVLSAPSPRFELLLEKIEVHEEDDFDFYMGDMDLYEMDPWYDESDLHAEE